MYFKAMAFKSVTGITGYVYATSQLLDPSDEEEKAIASAVKKRMIPMSAEGFDCMRGLLSNTDAGLFDKIIQSQDLELIYPDFVSDIREIKSREITQREKNDHLRQLLCNVQFKPNNVDIYTIRCKLFGQHVGFVRGVKAANPDLYQELVADGERLEMLGRERNVVDTSNLFVSSEQTYIQESPNDIKSFNILDDAQVDALARSEAIELCMDLEELGSLNLARYRYHDSEANIKKRVKTMYAGARAMLEKLKTRTVTLPRFTVINVP